MLNLTDEIGRPSGASDVPYLVFHAVVLVGGVVLLALDWIGPKPGTAGYVAAGAVAGAGMIISALSVRHGYPFAFVARDDGVGETDTLHAVADLIFWAYLGLMVVVVVSLFRRAPKADRRARKADRRVRKAKQPPDRHAPEQPADHGERQYIEHHGHTADQAQQKTVGPLP
jgi:hypothetical protein